MHVNLSIFLGRCYIFVYFVTNLFQLLKLEVTGASYYTFKFKIHCKLMPTEKHARNTIFHKNKCIWSFVKHGYCLVL